MDAVKDIEFPKEKSELISYINKNEDISEASKIALNKLEDKVYNTIEEICDNVKIVCDLEITDALSEMYFPCNKDDILDYVTMRNYSEFVIKSLEDLPDGYTFNNISDICKEIQ
jgi:hypothetical protein